MSLLATFLLPLAAAIINVFIQSKPRYLIGFNLTITLLLLMSATHLLMMVETEPQEIVFGGWPVPFGIEFFADQLSALLVMLIAIVSMVVIVFMVYWESVLKKPAYFALTQLLIASAIAVSLAADLFNLYVWFELMLIAVLGLLVLGSKSWHTEAAIKYFAVSMLGTLLMLAAIGMIYGASGHLNFDALKDISQQAEMADYLPLYSGVLLVALLLKIGAFPLFAWLPAAYHTLPAPLLALAGGLLTKISAYVLLRVSGQVLDMSLYYEALGWLAVITMLSGVLGAAYHWDLRRILAFHIVSQIGFLLLGIALASPNAITGTGFFMFHNILVKTNLFLIAAIIWWTAGHYDLRKVGGLYPASPLMAFLFLLSALSLVGAPPTSGFWGKLMIIQETFYQQQFVWGAAALLTGLLTLYSMSKIWVESFWKPHPEKPFTKISVPLPMMISLVLLSALILLMGLIPEPIIALLKIYQDHFWEVGV